MAGSLSDYAELKVLNHIVGKTSFTMPTVYLALYTAAPSDSGGGTEATYTGYARKVTAGSDWAAAATNANANAAPITFAACTAGSNTITHFALFDALTTGNMLAWGSLTASFGVSVGISPTFAIGAIVITAVGAAVVAALAFKFAIPTATPWVFW